MLPESLVRSCAIILGPESAELLKTQLQLKNMTVPHESTISRFRLRLDVTRLLCMIEKLGWDSGTGNRAESVKEVQA